MNAYIRIDQLLPAWQAFHASTDIGPIRDEAHYQRMTDTLNTLLDATVGNENHPAMGLVDIVGDLIEDYESEHYPLPAVAGVEALRFLIDQHHLKQSDLPEIGSQGVVSEVLTGKRALNIRQIQALSKRFSVTAATFL
jgi:HTH-type transcriptional regulator / antitoxin HigA